MDGFWRVLAPARAKSIRNVVPSVGSSDLRIGFVDVPAQRGRPEPREPDRIVRIEGQRDEPRR